MKKEIYRVAVTGGSRGIGLAIVEELLKNGHQVVVVDNNYPGMPRDVREAVTAIEFDLRRIEDLPGLAQQLGFVDCLINNAGIYLPIPFENHTPEQIMNVFRINSIAPAELSMKVAAQPGSILKRIVMVGSVSAHEGGVNGYYAASKAALENLTKSLAMSLGRQGICVNTVSPGLVEGTKVFYSVPTDRTQELLANAVSGRFTTPQEVARVVAFLIQDAPDNMTGATLDINGGAYMR